jgi:hypothetical protein
MIAGNAATCSSVRTVRPAGGDSVSAVVGVAAWEVASEVASEVAWEVAWEVA